MSREHDDIAAEALEDLAAEEHDRLWAEEAERRYAEYKAGNIEAVAAEEVFARIQSRKK